MKIDLKPEIKEIPTEAVGARNLYKGHRSQLKITHF
jgi:hypothetical protein